MANALAAAYTGKQVTDDRPQGLAHTAGSQCPPAAAATVRHPHRLDTTTAGETDASRHGTPAHRHRCRRAGGITLCFIQFLQSGLEKSNDF